MTKNGRSDSTMMSLITSLVSTLSTPPLINQPKLRLCLIVVPSHTTMATTHSVDANVLPQALAVACSVLRHKPKNMTARGTKTEIDVFRY
jgi:hypothetical protein